MFDVLLTHLYIWKNVNKQFLNEWIKYISIFCQTYSILLVAFWN
jgi:hypothetical protein